MINAIGINNVSINMSFIPKVGNPDIDIDHINKFKIKRDFFWAIYCLYLLIRVDTMK